MTRGHDEESVGIPLAIDPMLEEPQIAFNFLEFPAPLVTDLLNLLVQVQRFGEAEVDEDSVGVVFRPLVHDFEQVPGVILSVFFNPLLIGGIGNRGVAGAGGEKCRVSRRGGVAPAT